MEQKLVFQLVVDNMLPGLDVELGAFEDILNIMATSRLGNRRRVLQWVGARYTVVGLTKLHELRRVHAEFEVATEAKMAAWTAYDTSQDKSAYWAYYENIEAMEPAQAEYFRAILTYDRIEEEQSRLEMWFSPRRVSRGNWIYLQGNAFYRKEFWNRVLSFTLTKWSRLSLDE